MLRTANTAASTRQASALLTSTNEYVRWLANQPGVAALADATGFAPEGVNQAIGGLRDLDRRLSLADWEPDSLFGSAGRATFARLIGVMMQVPELRSSFEDISSGGYSSNQVAQLTQAWVSGASLHRIAQEFFEGDADLTTAITRACKAIYRAISSVVPWGIAALSRLPASGLNFEAMSDDQKRLINSLPAMVYHGVHSEAAVLMRMNSVPRSVAESVGQELERLRGSVRRATATDAREFLREMNETDWARHVPVGSRMNGGDYQAIWQRLSGESPP